MALKDIQTKKSYPVREISMLSYTYDFKVEGFCAMVDPEDVKHIIKGKVFHIIGESNRGAHIDSLCIVTDWSATRETRDWDGMSDLYRTNRTGYTGEIYIKLIDNLEALVELKRES